MRPFILMRLVLVRLVATNITLNSIFYSNTLSHLLFQIWMWLVFNFLPLFCWTINICFNFEPIPLNTSITLYMMLNITLILCLGVSHIKLFSGKSWKQTFFSSLKTMKWPRHKSSDRWISVRTCHWLSLTYYTTSLAEHLATFSFTKICGKPSIISQRPTRDHISILSVILIVTPSHTTHFKQVLHTSPTSLFILPGNYVIYKPFITKITMLIYVRLHHAYLWITYLFYIKTKCLDNS